MPDLRAAGSPKVEAAVCNVANEREVINTVRTALEKLGGMDVIVNNGGLMSFKPLGQQTEDDWLRILTVDLLGAFFFIKQAFLHMKSVGTVVNVSSIHGIETERLVAP